MDGQGGTSSFFDGLNKQTSRLFDAIANSVFGSAHNLRDGSEHAAVDLPRDLWAHDNVQTEWWYYTGHLQTDSGRKLGFEWVFFKRRTDLDRFAVVPVRLIGNPYYFAHFAVTDQGSESFRYAHRKSANGLLDTPARASKTHYYLNIGDWSARESHGMHHLRASIGDGTTFEIALRPVKPVVLNGEDGVSFKDKGEASRYFAYTRMEAEGKITLDGRAEHFTGLAWMDREFGTWAPTDNQKGWDWFSIQFENRCELMCYQLRDKDGNVSPYSSGTYIDAEGIATRLTVEDFGIIPLGTWTSPRTGAEYPSQWRITVPRFGVDVLVNPVLIDQELDTRGTTMIVYWEGSCTVKGCSNGESVDGNAYVELVGYDRSHESPDLAYFLIGNPNEILDRLRVK
jgi:predicted secreted hydrolase